jgi:hypothetical protein
VKLESLEAEANTYEELLNSTGEPSEDAEAEDGDDPSSPQTKSKATEMKGEDAEAAKKTFGKYLKEKLTESSDRMMAGLKGTARRMHRHGFSGKIGASIILGLFGFEIQIGVEIGLMDTTLRTVDDDDLKPGSGFLSIFVKQGTNLPAKDKTGTSDPYLTFKAGYHHVKGTVAPKTVNPIWNEYLRLDANINDIIRVRVYNHNKLQREERLGEQFYNLKQLGLQDGVSKEFKVKEGMEQGEVIFLMVFKFYNIQANHRVVKQLIGKEFQPPAIAVQLM